VEQAKQMRTATTDYFINKLNINTLEIMGFFSKETNQLKAAKQAFVNRLTELVVNNGYMKDGETASFEEIKRDVNMPNICGIKRKGDCVLFIDANGEERILSADNLTTSELATICSCWETYHLIKGI
jgi:hypothetical protein